MKRAWLIALALRVPTVAAQVPQQQRIDLVTPDEAISSSTNAVKGTSSHAVNAADFGTGTTAIQSAINWAASSDIAYVYLPRSFLPYACSSVTYNAKVHLVREGGPTEDWLWDVQAYGADPTGTTPGDACFTAAIAAAAAQNQTNLGGVGQRRGAVIFMGAGSFLVKNTIDLTSINAAQLVGVGQNITRIISGTTNAAGINASTFATQFTVLRDFSIFQGAFAAPPTARASGNYGIRVTGGVGFQLVIDKVSVNYFANDCIYIQGPTGPTIISNSSLQYCAGWGLEVDTIANGTASQNVQMFAGNIHNSFGGIKVTRGNGNQFHAVDIELANDARWPAIYLTAAAYGNSFYECTESIGPGAPALTNELAVPNNGVVVVDNGIANTFINGINSAANGRGTDNYRFTGSSDRSTVIGGNHTNTSVGGGFFAIVQSTNNTFIGNLVNASTYVTSQNTVSENSGVRNFTTIIGTGANGPLNTAGVSIGSSGLQVGRRIRDGEVNLTCGAAKEPALDASLASLFYCDITANVAVVLQPPTNAPACNLSQEIGTIYRNSSGGALGTVPTFSTAAGGFRFAEGSLVNPGNGTQVLYKWRWDCNQARWYLLSASTAL